MHRASFITLALLTGCFGQTDTTLKSAGPEQTPPTVVEPEPTAPEAACEDDLSQLPIRHAARLTPAQYRNTARDLFALPEVTADLAPPEGTIPTLLEVEKFATAAEALIATGGHQRFLPEGCSVTADHQALTLKAEMEACAEGFIEAFGLRVFRRPLSADAQLDEREWLLGRYRAVRDAHLDETDALTEPATFEESIGVVAEIMMQSAQHLYLLEEGEADPSLPTGVRRLTDFERAARLSYFLWETTPDDALLAAAATGELDEAGMRAQAARMLEDPRARAVVRKFASIYTNLNASSIHPSLEDNPKKVEKFPYDTPELRAAMRLETEKLFEHVMYEGDGRFATLLTTPRAYVNKALASLYGVTNGPTEDGQFAWVELNPQQRAGLFTRAAFLAQHADQEFQSPIHRGVHIFREVLCRPLGPPPPDANDVPPVPAEVDGKVLSMRQQTENRTYVEGCASCHKAINPIGNTLEHYDAMGAWQDFDRVVLQDGTIAEVPIDAADDILVTDIAGRVNGGVELSQRLAQSQEAHNCMAQLWYERATGAVSHDAPSCSLTKIQDRFRTSGDLRALLVDVTLNPQMLFIKRGDQP